MSDQAGSKSSEMVSSPNKAVKLWALTGGLLIVLATMGVASDRMMLWRVVQTCLAGHSLLGTAFPCLEVNTTAGAADGFAVLRAPREATHIIVTPTAPVIGIESPELLAQGAPNYMKDAWNSRHYVEDRLGRHLAWDDIGLAINSLRGRSQDQLHIHVDCVRSHALDLLHESMAEIGAGKWIHLKVPMAGTRYWALFLDTDDLSRINVFQLAKSGLQIKPDEQSSLSVAVLGAIKPDGRHGFYLLADMGPTDHSRYAHAEFLLDHSCAGRARETAN